MDRGKVGKYHYFLHYILIFLGNYVFPAYFLEEKIGSILKDMP